MITILCVGKIKEEYLQKLISDYYQRISKYHKIQIIEVKDNEDINKEKAALLKHFNSQHYNIALDINGEVYTSNEFAALISSTFNFNSDITFIIGGSNGLPDDLKKICNLSLSFSKLTFPHGLFRGMLLEQIYRAFKINNHESYHK